MKNKNKLSPNQPDEAESNRMKILDKVQKLIKSKDITDKLTAAIIVSSLDEVIADNIFMHVNLELNEKLLTCKHMYFINTQKIRRNSNTNLESSISRLDCFIFPYKKELLKILEQIKESRNELIHGLFQFNKNIDIKKLTNNIFEKDRELDIIHDKIMKTSLD